MVFRVYISLTSSFFRKKASKTEKHWNYTNYRL